VPADLVLRKPDDADAARVADLCNAVSEALHGARDADAEEVLSWFAMPELETLVAERDGGLVGYADVRRDDDGARFSIDIRVGPEARGTGVADRLLGAAEEWAAAHAKPGAVARGYPAERDAELRRALERAGYRLIRHSFHMQIDLPETVDEPEWPDGIRVRTYEPVGDERRVYECTEEAFADHWDFRPTPYDRWRALMFRRRDFDPTLWWLAEDAGELAGVCLNAWHYSGDRTFGWVGTLGVRRPWRRRGLGLALLRHSFADFRERGATKVGLGVDAENLTGAVRLYERAGMHVARRNDTYEKDVSGPG
jgi:mycothiol synthase